MYLNGAAGLKRDVAKATEYFQKAADLKYPDAQVNMGLLHASMYWQLGCYGYLHRIYIL